MVVLRPSPNGAEVLMVRRSRSASFMGNARVFPGGAVDVGDSGPAARSVVRWTGDPEEFDWRAAALREVAEEAGIAIGSSTRLEGVRADDPADAVYESAAAAGVTFDADRLAYVGNWLTPLGMPRRFDTRFYFAVVDRDTEPSADDREVFDAVWVTPREAFARGDSGEWAVELPTRTMLWLVDGFASPEEAFAFAATVETVDRIEPRIVLGDDGARVLLPSGGARR